jgi:hypothetical protein
MVPKGIHAVPRQPKETAMKELLFPSRLLRVRPWALAALALYGAFAAFSARADDVSDVSLRLDETSPLRWQARVQLNSQDALGNSAMASNRSSSWRLLSANLLGDYYLTGSGLGNNVRGGLRATGGVMLGPLSLLQSSGGLALGNSALTLGQGLAVGQHRFSLLTSTIDASDTSSSSMSYLGIGYTGQSMRGGWGFSADLGLVSGYTFGGLRLGRSTAQSMEDVLRDMRFKPVLQLGLSYSY